MYVQEVRSRPKTREEIELAESDITPGVIRAARRAAEASGEADGGGDDAQNGAGDAAEIALDMRMKPKPPRKRSRVESALWLLATVAILVYGDGKRHFLEAVLRDPRVHKQPFFVACLCVLVNTCVVAYLAFVRFVWRNLKHFDEAAPGANATVTLLSIMAFILFSTALWPVWGLPILPMLWSFFMSLVVVFSLVPQHAPKSAEDME
eukprot:TRINITY_DN4928_c0_g1_i1.p1 TRINITY_DN4928_c0_g1~~TRINITY_DN4928_c0_g1_i1.p1  ORF type:complete len:207 (-),score=8.12 TRINITY_DN4928_c0_g1_i1:17-637(-)